MEITFLLCKSSDLSELKSFTTYADAVEYARANPGSYVILEQLVSKAKK